MCVCVFATFVWHGTAHCICLHIWWMWSVVANGVSVKTHRIYVYILHWCTCINLSTNQQNKMFSNLITVGEFVHQKESVAHVNETEHGTTCVGNAGNIFAYVGLMWLKIREMKQKNDNITLYIPSCSLIIFCDVRPFRSLSHPLPPSRSHSPNRIHQFFYHICLVISSLVSLALGRYAVYTLDTGAVTNK